MEPGHSPLPVHTGGCQCGAVRFRVTGVVADASICHCRMCQKAFGAYYAPLVSVRGALLEWTRGQPQHFQSSNVVRRGFCARCGTPLSYEAPDGVAIPAGAFDTPERFPPRLQFSVDTRLPFVDGLAGLGARTTADDVVDAPFLAGLVSYQHPDHDTADWPPHRG
jgi:hypothetical protein